MKVLLSIKPEFVNKIFSGEKKFEFRRKIWQRSNIDTVVIYATKPVGKVVGEFSIKTIHEDSPENIWFLTKNDSGITAKFFKNYFFERGKAFAIEIESVVEYSEPKILQDFGISHAPQSFVYLK